MKLKNLSLILFSVSLVAASYFAFTRSQDIADWWFLRSYTPSQEISDLADKAFFNAEGRDLFYVTDPEINDATAFNQNCPFRERSFVLGCFASNRIYIFDVTDERLDGIKEVTAAHEMLHVVYTRLSSSERAKIDAMLEQELTRVENERVIDLVASYREADPDSIYNEMHSIFGTELRNVSSELALHYDQFFTDRSNLVQVAEDYESVFEEIQEESQEVLADIEGSRILINSLESQILDRQAVIAGIRSQLAVFREQIDTARAEQDANAEATAIVQFNELVGQLDEVITDHNQLVNQYNQTIEQVNIQVAQYNALVAEQGELIDSINSKLDTIPVEGQ